MAGYKPIFKRPEDEISNRVEEKVKSELDNRIKTEVENRVNVLLKEREEKEKADKANRIAKAVDTAKALKGEGDSEKDKVIAAEKEKAVAEKDILCPTCHTKGTGGHIHRADDKSGMIYRCTKDGCGFEAVLVPKDSDYKCVGCGAPLKKPGNVEHAKEMEGCPFCKNKRAVKFNWAGLWNVKK